MSPIMGEISLASPLTKGDTFSIGFEPGGGSLETPAEEEGSRLSYKLTTDGLTLLLVVRVPKSKFRFLF